MFVFWCLFLDCLCISGLRFSFSLFHWSRFSFVFLLLLVCCFHLLWELVYLVKFIRIYKFIRIGAHEAAKLPGISMGAMLSALGYSPWMIFGTVTLWFLCVVPCGLCTSTQIRCSWPSGLCYSSANTCMIEWYNKGYCIVRLLILSVIIRGVVFMICTWSIGMSSSLTLSWFLLVCRHV